MTEIELEQIRQIIREELMSSDLGKIMLEQYLDGQINQFGYSEAGPIKRSIYDQLDNVGLSVRRAGATD